MKDWKVNENGTVTLIYDEGTIIVSRKDFNRAFGTMCNSKFDDVKKSYAI